MIRSLLKFHLSDHLTRLSVGKVVPVRFHPRRSQQLFPPPNLLQDEDGDALVESDVNSHLDVMEDNLYGGNSDKKLQEKARRLWLKKKIVERKYFKKPSELNLLSWRAREQIFYLHNEYPNEWSVAKLAKSFPVSEKGIIKVLKSSYNPTAQHEIDIHDARIRKNWRALRSYLSQQDSPLKPHIAGPIAHTVKELVTSDRLSLMINAGGISNVTIPKKNDKIFERKQVGTFEAVVKDYVEKKLRSEQEKNASASMSPHEYEQLLRDISNTRIVTHQTKDVNYRSQEKYGQGASEIDGAPDRAVSRRGRRLVQSLKKGSFGAAPLVNSHLEELGMQETGLAGTAQQRKGDNSEWTNTKHDHKNHSRGRMEVMNNIRFDEHSNRQDGTTESDADMYEPGSGYQSPQSEHLEKLEVPRSLKHKGDLYQRGNYVYDEDGEFLYKIP